MMKRFLSVVLCLCLLCGVPAGSVFAEKADHLYEQGTFECMFIPGNGTATEHTLSALHDMTDGTLYLDAVELCALVGGNCVVSGSTAELQVYYRYFTFHENSDKFEYQVHDIVSDYRMSSEAIVKDDVFWIPGHDLLYLMGCPATPVDWDKNDDLDVNDVLLLQPAQMTVLDVLCYLEENHYKDICNFDLNKSLTIEEEDLQHLKNAAYAFTAARHILGGELNLLDSESVYERQFLDKMLFPDDGYLESTMDNAKSMASLADEWLSYASDNLNESGEGLMSWALHLVEQMNVKSGMDDGVEAAQMLREGKAYGYMAKGMSVLGEVLSGLITVSHYQQLNETTLKAMDRFIDPALNMNILTVKFKALTLEATTASVNQLRYSLVETALDKILSVPMDAFNGATGYGIVSGTVDTFWSLLEATPLLDVMNLSDSDDADALLAACVGSVYETAALKTMDDSWAAFLAARDDDRDDLLEEAALMAFNYMRSCSVTIDLAMQGLGFENSEKQKSRYLGWMSVKQELDDLCLTLENDFTMKDNGKKVFGFGLPINQTTVVELTTGEILGNWLGATYVEIEPLCEFDLYYKYLREEVLVKETHIAANDTMTFSVGKSGGYSMPDQALGLLSADVRDYSGDGIEDMITVELARFPHRGTYIQLLEEEDSSTWSANNTDTGFCVKLYTIEKGEVVLKNTIYVNGMYDGEWGLMRLGVQIYNGVWYLSAYSEWEDETVGTSNYRPGIIFHVNRDFEFITDNLFGRISWGQHACGISGSSVFGNRNVDFSDTVVEYMRSAGREACRLCEAETDGYARTITSTDFTSLRIGVENGRAAIRHPVKGDATEAYLAYVAQQQAKQQEAEDKTAAVADTLGVKAEAILNYIISSSGRTVTEAEYGYDSLNRYRIFIKCSGGANVTIYMDDVTCEAREVWAYSVKSSNKAEWIDLKDAVITCPDMPFGAYSAYTGDVRYCDDDTTKPGYFFQVLEINDWILLIRQN